MVTINSFLTVFDQLSWDIHGSKPFISVKQMKEQVAPMYDQGYSALIEDLHERGLLDDTMVTTLSEFGRTPKVNPAGGRDHWPQCFTCSFAGGGVQGGRVVGKAIPSADSRPSDRWNRATSWRRSFTASASTPGHLPGPSGRPFPLVDFGNEPIKELFAWDHELHLVNAVVPRADPPGRGRGRSQTELSARRAAGVVQGRLQRWRLPRRTGRQGRFPAQPNAYDPATDHYNITRENRGRRIEFAAPASSLFVTKPTAAVRHKGGKVLRKLRGVPDPHALDSAGCARAKRRRPHDRARRNVPPFPVEKAKRSS